METNNNTHHHYWQVAAHSYAGPINQTANYCFDRALQLLTEERIIAYREMMSGVSTVIWNCNTCSETKIVKCLGKVIFAD
jgi:hypothetical protein